MNGATNGYAAYKVADTVTTPRGLGPGQLLLLQRRPDDRAPTAASRCPSTPDVKFHSLLTVSLGGNGVIDQRHQQHRRPRAGHGDRPGQRRQLPVARRSGPARAVAASGPGQHTARTQTGLSGVQSSSARIRSSSASVNPAMPGNLAPLRVHRAIVAQLVHGRPPGAVGGVVEEKTEQRLRGTVQSGHSEILGHLPRTAAGRSSRRRRPRRRRTCRTGRGR